MESVCNRKITVGSNPTPSAAMRKDDNTVILLKEPDSGVHLNTLERRISRAGNVRTPIATEETIKELENRNYTRVVALTDNKDVKKRVSSIAEVTFDSGDAILVENSIGNLTNEKADEGCIKYVSNGLPSPGFEILKRVRTRKLIKDKLEILFIKFRLDINEFFKPISKY